MRKIVWIMIITTLLAVACRQAPSPTAEAPTEPSVTQNDPIIDESPAESTEPAAEIVVTESAEANPDANLDANPGVARPMMAPLPAHARDAVSAAQLAAAAELAAAFPPQRDDARLAIAYRGLTATPGGDATPLPPGPAYAIGDTQPFNIPNVNDNTVSVIDAKLFAVSDHAYFWFDTGPASITPDDGDLVRAVDVFDEIYENDIAYFGPENNPGIDGDARLHIVHASPLALCGVQNGCGLAGLVNSIDMLPQEVDPRSNEREMFVMNVEQFGTDYYFGVLAHEFRHMIEDNYDDADNDWEKEGSATLASELLGLQSGGPGRAQAFLSLPDQQLNSWRTDGGAGPYYGMGYLLNRYLFDQFGEEAYREFAVSPLPGLLAVDAVSKANGFGRSGDDVWLDWQTALALIGEDNVPAIYQFGTDGLTRASAEALPPSPETTVSQYAADYYDLNGSETISFSGSTQVPLLGTIPPSGESFWYAQRANGSNPRLTRAVDLTGVESATLTYSVYADIEEGYDFAYVAVSTDGGTVWQPVSAENMQGLEPSHDPSGAALADRFYTGRTQAWVDETVDLTPFAGQKILLRFEYLTDPILTFGGFALDDIAIPEIGFADDAEAMLDGWQAEGFSRTTAYLPQNWHVRLITFEDGVPVVSDIPLDADQSATFETGSGRAILMIAASAPFTLEPATYQLRGE